MIKCYLKCTGRDKTGLLYKIWTDEEVISESCHRPEHEAIRYFKRSAPQLAFYRGSMLCSTYTLKKIRPR